MTIHFAAVVTVVVLSLFPFLMTSSHPPIASCVEEALRVFGRARPIRGGRCKAHLQGKPNTKLICRFHSSFLPRRCRHCGVRSLEAEYHLGRRYGEEAHITRGILEEGACLLSADLTSHEAAPSFTMTGAKTTGSRISLDSDHTLPLS